LAVVADSVDALVAQVKKAAQPGDHILCMSNGGFGSVHGKLLEALSPGTGSEPRR
jgi:UDP-N-acetylmuramate: L-alanyl-gamma-D-glutamyl-meso-diaminopimelate ligase